MLPRNMECKECGQNFDPMGSRKRNVGGYVNICAGCTEEGGGVEHLATQEDILREAMQRKEDARYKDWCKRNGVTS